jgi:hypothetical protein
MGHYAAISKNLAEEYRTKLAPKTPEENLAIKIDDLQELKKLKNEQDIKGVSGRRTPINYDSMIKNLEGEIKYLSSKYDIKNIKKNGQVYKLSIPKDDVMLREGATFAEQPKAVQDGLENYFKDLVALNKGGFQAGKTLVTPVSEEQLLRDYIYNNGDGTSLGIYRGLADRKKTFHELHKDPISSNYAQQQITNDLSDYGIKGISYNGGIDGEARVIFNPDDIEIVRKYYNQPSLGEMLLKKSPNAGATSNYLYDLMIRE